MFDDQTDGRWPPAYDAEQLARDISELVKRGLPNGQFYSLKSLAGPPVCQGDIVALDADVPVIDKDGEAIGEEGSCLWLVIGNTCDFARRATDVAWTQMVPVIPLDQPSSQELSGLLSYKGSRVFYLPPWPGGTNTHSMADLLRPVAVHKDNFANNNAKVVARMDRPAWVLLHCCLIRFLARDDGRFDSA